MSDDAIETPPDGGLTGWKAAFVEALRESPNVSAAAKAAGMNRQYVYEARGADPLFAVAWDDALAEAVDALEAEVFRRATKGTRRPVYYKGSECGAYREFSDALAMFLLKSHRAAVYRDRVSSEHSGEVKVTVSYADEPGDLDQAEEAAPGPDPDPPVEGPV